MNIESRDFADSIDNYCTGKKILKDEFFRETGITSGSLSQWRSGNVQPSLKKVRAVERYAQMPIDQFIALYKNRPTLEEDGQDAELDEIMELARVAPPAARKFLLAGLRAAVAQAAEAQDGLSK